MNDNLVRSSPAAFKILRITAAQVEQMHALLDVFAAAFDDANRYTKARPSRTYLVELLADASFFALVARDDASIIGGLVAYELRKFEQECSEIYIYDLAVSEAYRRNGVASALIETLKPLAAARKASVIFVQAEKDDPPAIALYSRLGTREDVVHFDIPVT
ncbi:RimI Acetyltransferases [Rhabdaerophilaceae bacterium]